MTSDVDWHRESQKLVHCCQLSYTVWCRLYAYQPCLGQNHDDVIKWKHFPRYWPFVRGIHRSPVNSPHKGQWRTALIFTLICVWINGCVNNREARDFRRYYAHYGVTVMLYEGIALHKMNLRYLQMSFYFALAITVLNGFKWFIYQYAFW